MIAPLLQDGTGWIDRAAVALSAFSVGTFPGAIQSVLRTLPKDIRLEVLTAPSVAGQVSGWLDAAGRSGSASVHVMPEDLDVSLWLQDPILIRSDWTTTVSEAFERYDDWSAARLLVERLGWPEILSSIQVDGGNVLTHGDVVLVGSDAVADDVALVRFDQSRTVLQTGTAKPCAEERTRSTERPEPRWHETLDYLSAQNTRQPIFHLDHMIAPCGFEHGKPRFMVGCPKMGARTIGHPIWPQVQADAFDEIARLLRRRGMAVVRNPQPLAWVDRPEQRQRRWFHLPVNNVLIHGDAVLLPCFASKAWPELEALDAENTALWQSLGFEVIPVPDLMALAEAMGGPRCMVKVLARG